MSGSVKLRVLLISFHFAPTSVSGTHRAVHFARALKSADHEVHVLTAEVPAGPSDDDRLLDIFPCSARIHRVSKRRTVGDLWNWVQDRLTDSQRLASAEPRHRAREAEPTPGILRRIARALDTFPDHERGWLGPAVRAGRRLSRSIDFDVVVATAPPWTALRAAHRIAGSTGARLVLDFRDPWSYMTGGPRPETIEQRVAGRMEARIVAASDLLVFNSPVIARLAEERGVQPDTMRVVLNGTAAPRNERKRSIDRGESLKFRHFGTLYGGRSLAELAGLLQELAPRVGGPTPILEQFGVVEDGLPASSDGLETRWHPALPFDEALELMREPSVLVVVQPTSFAPQIPTKLYDYLATGNPIVIVAPQESAVWEIGAEYGRCRLAPLDSQSRSRATVGSILQAWARGELMQEPVLDTRRLEKSTLNQQFVEYIEDLCAVRESHS